MADQHPITPPPKLIKQWLAEFYGPLSPGMAPGEMVLHIAAVAARWGADQQLEQCEKYWMTHGISPEGVVAMRYALRPMPPSLKEQAMKALDEAVYMADDVPPEGISTDQADTIRRALESLPD